VVFGAVLGLEQKREVGLGLELPARAAKRAELPASRDDVVLSVDLSGVE
jgi:hypothetical protein